MGYVAFIRDAVTFFRPHDSTCRSDTTQAGWGQQAKPSQIFKTEELRSHHLIRFLYLVQLNLEQPLSNRIVTKLDLFAIFSHAKQIIQKSPKTFIPVLITLACLPFCPLRTTYIPLNSEGLLCSKVLCRERGAVPSVSACRALALLNSSPVLPLSTSFPACRGLISKQKRWNVTRPPHTVYSLDATRRASAEGEEFNSNQEKEDNSNQEAAFDLGLEEGAEFQDGKLGRRIWPLWTEYFAKF